MRWILGTTLAIVVVAALITLGTMPAEATAERSLRAANAAIDIAPIIVGFGAVIFVVGDFGFGYIGTTLTLTPSRNTVIASKLLAVGILAIAVSAASVAVTSAAFVLHQLNASGALGTVTAWGAVSVAALTLLLAYTALGAGVALVTCRSVSAVVLYLTMLFALPLAASVLSIWVPGAGQRILDFSPVTLTSRLVEEGPSWSALWRFALLDGVLLSAGVMRGLRVAVR
ncbi:MAG: hypothetical protein AAGC80_03425 [Rhodococcus sp. (in: high G+C Gram-positive bacteria)]